MSPPTPSLLQATPQLSAYDRARWVVRCPSGHQLLLTASAAALLGILAEAPTLEAGWRAFAVRFGGTLTLAEFSQLLRENFGGYQLLRDDTLPVRPAAPMPFHLHREVVPARWAARLAAPLAWLYAPACFWPLLGGSTVAILSQHFCLPLPALTASQGAGVAGALYASVLVHELGHIAACRRAGLLTGSIGVGLLYGVPLLYADITALWGGTRQQRLIGNLGGIYGQLLLAAVAAAVGVATGRGGYRLAADVIALSAAWQLNPFVRHDGYWVLSDLLAVPNLQQRAAQVQRHVLSARGLVQGRVRRLTAGELGLLSYAVANTLLLVLLVGFGLWRTLPQLPVLPPDYARLLHHLRHGPRQLTDLGLAHLPALGFFAWLGRTAWLRLRRLLPKRP